MTTSYFLKGDYFFMTQKQDVSSELDNFLDTVTQLEKDFVSVENESTGDSIFDFFGRESWVNYEDITINQKLNRQLLQDVMLKHGFKNYPKEWWHFTLKDEPFPDTYFDFPIK